MRRAQRCQRRGKVNDDAEPDAGQGRGRHAADAASQSGAGTFAGDIDFSSGDWDGTEKVPHIDTATCPVVMMTGEYDYSCTPRMSEQTAARIPGAVFWEMRGLGHFPICENPAAFAPHLDRALQHLGGPHD